VERRHLYVATERRGVDTAERSAVLLRKTRAGHAAVIGGRGSRDEEGAERGVEVLRGVTAAVDVGGTCAVAEAEVQTVASVIRLPASRPPASPARQRFSSKHLPCRGLVRSAAASREQFHRRFASS
jgi:hypothetical protein